MLLSHGDDKTAIANVNSIALRIALRSMHLGPGIRREWIREVHACIDGGPQQLRHQVRQRGMLLRSDRRTLLLADRRVIV
jgi:hypothetical protein